MLNITSFRKCDSEGLDCALARTYIFLYAFAEGVHFNLPQKAFEPGSNIFKVLY